MIDKENYTFNGINVYVDEYQTDNNILIGRKGGDKHIICNTKTSNILKNILRNNKLKSL